MTHSFFFLIFNDFQFYSFECLMLPPIHKFIKKPQTITTHFHRGDGKCMTFCTEKMQPPPGLMDAAAELHTCVCGPQQPPSLTTRGHLHVKSSAGFLSTSTSCACWYGVRKKSAVKIFTLVQHRPGGRARQCQRENKIAC